MLRTYPKILSENFKTFGYPVIEIPRFELGRHFWTLISCEILQFYNVMSMDITGGLLSIEIFWRKKSEIYVL